MFDKIKGTIEMIKSLDKGTLEGIRWTLIFILILDVGLFYWFMKWKKFGIALLLVLCIILAIILILERRFPAEKKEKEVKMKEKKCPKCGKNINFEWNYHQECGWKKEKKETNEETEVEDRGFGIDLGLGSAEEYQERLRKAIG